MVEIREKNYDNLVYSTRSDIVFPEKQDSFCQVVSASFWKC